MMTYQEAYELCCQKAKLHFEKYNDNLFEPPESYDGDYYESYPKKDFDFASNYWCWLVSMIPGLAPIMFETKGDAEALKWANRFKADYHKKVFAPLSQTMHDLGFLYIPYSVYFWQLTGDTEHRDTALKAADELAKRFNIHGRYIEAWKEMDNTSYVGGRMIIDSSMNVPLLYWAWKETGHRFYRDVADAHMETIINVFVREDYSVAHSYFFNSMTGELAQEANTCGYANGSHWARGTAWVVYGLAMAYSYTKNEHYLEVATKIGEKYLDCLGDSLIPVWDFRLPEDEPAKFCGNVKGKDAPWDETKKENIIYNVDTSASAIMSCAFLLINSLKPKNQFKKYADNALSCLANE